MEVKPLEVYSETSNYGVVRMPGRNYPGCVIQGDSLSILCGLARAIRDQATQSKDSDLCDDADELFQMLDDRRSHYEQVMGTHGISLPYNAADS